MQLRTALRNGLTTLVEENIPSPELAAELLLMHVLGCDRSFLYTHSETAIDSETADRYFRLVAERAGGKPTQYITGHQEFWGLDLEVSPAVLIPRPETELLVQVVLGLANRPSPGMDGFGASPPPAGKRHDQPLKIADVGTGSGCIALALASELENAHIFATDISPAALAVARRNATKLGLSHRVKFLEADLLAPWLNDECAGTFDFVVSNPPYVARNELHMVQREVREFEPPLAWGDLERGDEIYSRLIPQALHLLKPSGCVAFEIGYNKRDRILGLLGDGWIQPEVHSDLAGIPRVIAARKGGRESLVDHPL